MKPKLPVILTGGGKLLLCLLSLLLCLSAIAAEITITLTDAEYSAVTNQAARLSTGKTNVSPALAISAYGVRELVNREKAQKRQSIVQKYEALPPEKKS